MYATIFAIQYLDHFGKTEAVNIGTYGVPGSHQLPARHGPVACRGDWTSWPAWLVGLTAWAGELRTITYVAIGT